MHTTCEVIVRNPAATLFYQLEIELDTAENTLFALLPINRTVPTTITKITASMTAYSAMSCPRSSDQSCFRKLVTNFPP